MWPTSLQKQLHQFRTLELRLLVVATAVRAAYLGVVVVSSRVIADYDTSASLLSKSCADTWPESAAAAQQYLPGVVWDSIFFHRITACGYEYEQFFAFYPGLPGVVRLLQATGLASGPHAFAIIALCVNNASFLLSVWLLTKLGQALIQDDKVVATAVLVFIASPASIHHTLLYTEALFTATSWLGFYCLYCRRSMLAASLAFAGSSAIRSNGLLNVGFILHDSGKQVLECLHRRQWAAALKHTNAAVGCTIICALPYLAYMAFSFTEFCTGVYGADGPHQPRPWCSQAIPSAYGYVQREYWQVGFLKYYRMNQIANFFLAGPTLVMSLWGALAYAAACPHVFATGGLLPLPLLQSWFSRHRELQRHSSGGGSSSGGGNSSGAGLYRTSSGSGTDDSRRSSAGGVAESRGSQQQQQQQQRQQRSSLLGSCCCFIQCIVGHAVYCGSEQDDAAVTKGPAIPGVAFQPLRQRQQEVSGQKQLVQQQASHGQNGQSPAQAAAPGALRHRQHTAVTTDRRLSLDVGSARSQQQQQQQQEQQRRRQQQQLQQQQLQQQQAAPQGLWRQGSDGAVEYQRHRAATRSTTAVRHRSRSSSAVRYLANNGSAAHSTPLQGRQQGQKPTGCSCASNAGYYRPEQCVFVIHWLALTLVCLAVVHIQVSTRLLSSCVPLYWFAALLMLHKGPVLRWLLWWYCFAYMGVGAIMFINFYPWV